MLIQNVVQGKLVNGSTGIVVDFLTLDEVELGWPDVEIPRYADSGGQSVPPMVHVENQGGTQGNDMKFTLGLDAEIRIPKVDATTATWFASPVTPMEGEDGARDCDMKPGPLAGEVPDAIKWPVVEFGDYGKIILPATGFSVVNVFGWCEAARSQVPLILAWAISIHKSQGQTLPRVKVDLDKVFEKGQAYVALSRAQTLDGLQVTNYNPAKVMAHPRVIAWSKTLRSSWDPNSTQSQDDDEEPMPASSFVIRSEVEYDSFESEFEGEDAIRAYYDLASM